MKGCNSTLRFYIWVIRERLPKELPNGEVFGINFLCAELIRHALLLR